MSWIYILAVLPRYFLKPCCDDTNHCANVCRHDETTVDAGKKLLQDLKTLNQQLASRLNGRNTQFLFTGDILSAKNHCGMGDLVNCLYECWRSDPVHGDKSPYLKLAMGSSTSLSPSWIPTTHASPAGNDAGRPALALMEAPLLRISSRARMTARMTGPRGATDTAPAPTTWVFRSIWNFFVSREASTAERR